MTIRAEVSRHVQMDTALATGSTSDAEIGLVALVMPVIEDWYALEMSQVREVVAAPRVSALPAMTSTVIGVFNLRGEIVPLFDTAALLGLGTMPSSSFAIVVESPLGPAGLAASGVPEAVRFAGPGAESETPGTALSYALGHRIVTLLDLQMLLEPDSVGAQRTLQSGQAPDDVK
ncbi:MAG: chemotaxis protein CheW [Acidimicrobiales bacterium]|nr:chemotaxis protein CheW [Acidimicrobiales bacterium]